MECHVEQVPGALVLSGIADEADVESLCNFLREQRLPAGIDADGRIVLTGLTMEHFVKLAEGANIELI